MYLEFPGWKESTAGMRDGNKLPAAARAYPRAVEELSGCRVAIVATGAERDGTKVVGEPFGQWRDAAPVARASPPAWGHLHRSDSRDSASRTGNLTAERVPSLRAPIGASWRL